MLRRHPGQAARLATWFTLSTTMLAACVAVGQLRSTAAGPAPAQPPQAQDKARTDAHGDALPAGARARLGTIRWRHGDNVTFVAYLPDGKAVVTASQDGTLRLWDRATGKELHRFQGPGAKAPAVIQPGARPGVAWGGRFTTAVALSRDGKVLAAAYPGLGIQLWDTATGKELRQIKGPVGNVSDFLFTPDGKALVARSTNRIIYVLDTATGNEIRQITQGKQQAGGNVVVFVGGNQGAGMALSPDGKSLAIAETEINRANGTIATHLRVVELATGKDVRRIDTMQNGVSGLAYSPDGKLLAFGSGNAVVLLEAATAKEVRKLDRPAGVSALVFAPDGKSLAAKGADQVTRLWETDTGKELHQFGKAANPAAGNVVVINSFGNAGGQDLAFAPDGKSLATGGSQVVRFWDVGTGKEVALGGGHRGPVTALGATPDGKTLVSFGADHVVRRWDAATGRELSQFAAPAGVVNAAIAPDGRIVALGIDDTVRLVDAVSGKELHQLKGHANGAEALTFSPDGKVVASRGRTDIRLHDVATGAEVRHIPLPVDKGNGPNVVMVVGGRSARGQALAFSPDGKTLAAHMASSPLGFRPINQPAPAIVADTIRLWDVSTGKEVHKLTLPQTGTQSLAWSPDGRVLATENGDQTVTLWEVASAKERARLGTAQPVGPVVGGFTAVGGVGRFGAPPVTSPTLAFSPDGRLLTAKGAANAVALWDVQAAKEVAQFKGHDGAVTALAFTPDGKAVVSGSQDTTILVWEAAELKREPAAAVELQAAEVQALWNDLIGSDAGKAYRGILRLAAAPKQAVPLLREKLRPAAPVDAGKLEEWVADLDSKNFAKRNKATEELAKLGDLAVPALQKVLTGKPSLETQRRVDTLLEKLTTGALTEEQLRLVRAVEVLERLGTAEGRQVLEALANGAPGALATRQAQAALQRSAGK